MSDISAHSTTRLSCWVQFFSCRLMSADRIPITTATSIFDNSLTPDLYFYSSGQAHGRQFD